MNFLSSGIFWGMFLILIGLSIIVKIVFNIDIPIFRIIIGALLIYFGLQIIFGSNFLFRRRIRMRHVERQYREYNLQRGTNEYNIIFGRGTVDLTGRVDATEDNLVSINVIFGSAYVYFDPHIPMQIEVNTVFGSANMPGKKFAVIGQEKFHVGDTEQDASFLYVEISTIFGSVELIEKTGKQAT